MKNEATIVRPEHMTPTEYRIVSGLVRRALSRGYTVSVNDDHAGHGDWTVKRSRSAAEIVGALATTGGDLLKIRTADGAPVGVVQLIYNGDETVIADHTDNAATNALMV